MNLNLTLPHDAVTCMYILRASTRHCDMVNTALSVVYLSIFYCIVVYWGPFLCIVSFVAICSVFWLFWLSCHYLPSDWLERPL